MATEDIPPPTLNPVPVIDAWEIVTVAVPVLVSIKVCILLDPATTLPKLRLMALAARVPNELGLEPEPDFPAGVPAPVNPTQPASDISARHEKIKVNMPSGARWLNVACVLRRLF